MRNWLDRLLGFVLIIALALALFGLVSAGRAKAHSFYPYECCHDQDCWPMGRGEREPDPVLTPQGWRLFDGEIVAFADTRPSPDGRFHVCRKGGAAEGAVIRASGKPCLWVPPQGS
ncbi:MAG: hypothetical protein ACRDBL_09145 [Rhabdaerophilum sp.]